MSPQSDDCARPARPDEIGVLRRFRRYLPLAVVAALIAPGAAEAQLRVATWNITTYGGGLTGDLQTAIYGVYQDRSLRPDVIVCQEFLSQSAANSFLAILNSAPGSPGDWAAAPFTDGVDTDNAGFYRTSRVTFLGATVIAVGSSDTNNQPRDTDRYDFRLFDYTSPAASFGIYSSHMKAQGGTNSAGRRLIEAQRIRANASGQNTNGPGTALPAGFRFILGGDLNMQNSSEPAYIELTGSQENNSGRFFDPISTPGNWNNNAAYRFVHTQDPAGAGGMDDRHDQLLVSQTLVDGHGFDYLGAPSIPYSTTTWNDPLHSYRAWGNDGTSFDGPLTIIGNAMVGQTIAQALYNAASGQGHLPVFLDLRVPAKVGAPAAVDFGSVQQGQPAQQTLVVANAADVARWTAAGIDALDYTLAASAGFTVPAGPFSAPAGESNSHVVTMDTTTPGPHVGTLTIASDAADGPVHIVQLSGLVLTPCLACDADCSGQVTVADVQPLVDLLLGTGTPCAPCAGDGNADSIIDGRDVATLLQCLLAAP